jgi:hypothetical protein
MVEKPSGWTDYTMPQETILGRALPMNQDRKKERLKEGVLR